MENKKQKAIALVRVSTEGQAGEFRGEFREGLKAQHETNALTARLNNLDLVKTFEIVNVSGAVTLHSPEMRELLEWAKRPEITGLVCAMYSRIMRVESDADAGYIRDTLKNHNVKIYEAGSARGLDLNTFNDDVVSYLKGKMAYEEMKTMVAHSWRAKESRRKAGIYVGPLKGKDGALLLPGHGAHFSTGTMWVPDHGWKYVAPIEDIKRAFEMFAAGDCSYADIGRTMNLNPATLRGILRNPCYMGWNVTSKWCQGQPREYGPNGEQRARKLVERPEDQIIRTRMKWDGEPVEPAVDPALWEEVQKIADAKATQHWRTSGPRHKQDYTYVGFLFCAQCGFKYYGLGFPRRYYRCGNYNHAFTDGTRPKNPRRADRNTCTAKGMAKERFEEILDTFFSRYLTSKKYLDEMFDLYLDLHESGKGERSRPKLEAAIARLEAAKKKVRVSWEEGDWTDAEKDARLASINADLASARKALKTNDVIQRITPERLAERFSLFTNYRRMTREGKRRVLATVRPELFAEDYRILRLRIDGVDEAPAFEPQLARGSRCVGIREHGSPDCCDCWS